MSKSGGKQLFDLYERMDRLEELLEDMDELGIATREEAEHQIVALDRQIEELEASGDGDSDD